MSNAECQKFKYFLCTCSSVTNKTASFNHNLIMAEEEFNWTITVLSRTNVSVVSNIPITTVPDQSYLHNARRTIFGIEGMLGDIQAIVDNTHLESGFYSSRNKQIYHFWILLS